ncbi:MAG: alanine racemase [Planctomycetes bacterium]|nr:alanine racemase [Planctomycetota bacterium]
MAPASFDPRPYALERWDAVPTPRLLVYREKVERNIARMREHLESVLPGSGFRHLTPHAKTHKSAWATQLMIRSGIERFKCTLNELDMLLAAGAEDVLVSYPLLAQDADRVAALAAAQPAVRIAAQVAHPAHAERLASAARRHGVELDCLIDLDVGMHRTGLAPAHAAELASSILRSPRLGPLRLRGIHAYDGHNSSPDPAERDACARRGMEEVARCVLALEAAGASVDRVVVGGTPGFLHDLRELACRHGLEARCEVSPGTWVYWDSNYEAKVPGLFEYAGLVLAQVMDRPGPDLATLNLGYKRWAADQGPVDLLSHGLKVIASSEEHTVVRLPEGLDLAIEDHVLIVPKHICSTVNLWETFTLVGPGGRIEEREVPVSGRNR